ncbi:MAG: YbaB/EbfC family nucleoid-associated protein [Clostridia bacterium]|nr:YbaB/EbfC family nucleoid-associated protein [Clostridia bacterium]
MGKYNGGGFPGMGGNMNQLLRQAQKMQNDMMKSQEEIEQKEFEVSSGGGAVTIVMNGKKILKSIKIKPEVVDPDDVEMLEDLILTAFKEGVEKADSIVEAEMGKYNIPGGMNGLF